MCNLGMAIEMRGVEKGRAEGRAEGEAKGIKKGLLTSIEKLMKTMKLTAQQAMDALEIPDEERADYTAMLASTE